MICKLNYDKNNKDNRYVYEEDIIDFNIETHVIHIKSHINDKMSIESS